MFLPDVLIVSVQWQAKCSVFLLHVSVGILLMMQPRQEVNMPNFGTFGSRHQTH